MARTKETVQSFIETVRSKLKPIYDEEIRQLSDYAQEKSSNSKEYQQLQSWDVPYWRHRQFQDLNKSLNIDFAQISRHFSYEKVLDGVFRFVDDLFGVQFQLDNSFDEEYKWHPDVQVYRCVENGETIGHLFIDAFARSNEKSELTLAVAGRGSSRFFIDLHFDKRFYS